jgi:hypothetical protein
MKAARAKSRRGGNAQVEFTLLGIPIIFILISVFELSRGMWIYNTLAYAVKDAVRYAAVHGQLCVQASLECAVHIGGDPDDEKPPLARRIERAGVGLLPENLSVTIWSSTRPPVTHLLKDWFSITDCFPTASDCTATVDLGAMQGMPITITARYPFKSAISMFWPGGGKGMVFGTFNLPASARENIQF